MASWPTSVPGFGCCATGSAAVSGLRRAFGRALVCVHLSKPGRTHDRPGLGGVPDAATRGSPAPDGCRPAHLRAPTASIGAVEAELPGGNHVAVDDAGPSAHDRRDPAPRC